MTVDVWLYIFKLRRAQLFGKLVLWINNLLVEPSTKLSLSSMFSKVTLLLIHGHHRLMDSKDILYFIAQGIWINTKKMKATGADEQFHLKDTFLLLAIFMSVLYSRLVCAIAELLFFTKCQWNKKYHRLAHKYIFKVSTPSKAIFHGCFYIVEQRN